MLYRQRDIRQQTAIAHEAAQGSIFANRPDLSIVFVFCYNFLLRFIHPLFAIRGFVMKVLSSLKSAKARHRDCKVVRRRGKVFVICKSNPRFKARQR